MNSNILIGKKHIHFIGIGGSGMYPLAQILHQRGYYLTGSDNNETETLKAVRDMGIPVYLGQRRENIGDADVIVYSAAIMSDNEELIAAKESSALLLERSDLLGLVCDEFSNAICVSGTHGKTSTSGMITQIFMEAGKDPSTVVGGKIEVLGGSGRVGKTENFICEACEYVDTFLKLSPNTAVILNIDYDHMEYFKTRERLIGSFEKFALMATDKVIYNGDDENTLDAIASVDADKRVTFGYNSFNNYYAENIDLSDGASPKFTLCKDGEAQFEVELSVPGKHNVINAVCACAVAMENGIDGEKIKSALKAFKGAKRRFEIIGKVGGVTIADDYGHHPTELRATLTTAKTLNFKRVIAVFQPFTYSRTAMLMDDFAEVLRLADKTVLSEIMGSREKNTLGVYSSQLAEKIPGAVWFNTFEEIKDYCLSFAKEGDLVITLGCGDIYKAAKMMVE